MSDSGPIKSVERLFPFVLRSRTLLVGRETLGRSKGKLHFVLITRDISENSRAQILNQFMHYPVVQHYTEADLEKFFNVQGAKVVGFAKSGLAQSIYAELKEHRINRPVESPKPRDASEKIQRPTKHKQSSAAFPGIASQTSTSHSSSRRLPQKRRGKDAP